MNRQHKIGIVVVIYNGEEYLPDLIDSLKNISIPDGFELKYFFIDNKSSDKSVEYLEENRLDDMDIVRLDKNLGFAGGNNVGIKKALECGCDYLLLLNQDTVVMPDFLIPLINRIEKDESVFSVQPLIMYHSDREMVNVSGGMMHFLGLAFARDNLEKKQTVLDRREQDENIFYSSGACCMIRARALKEIGFFDEEFESYHEDLDLGFRARIAGYRNVLERKSVIYHKYVFLKQKKSSKYKYYLMERNKIYFMLKYYPLAYFILIIPAFFAMEVGILFFSFFKGFWKEKLKSYLYVFINVDKLYKQRLKIREKYSDFDSRFYKLSILFVPVISFQEIDNFVLNKIANPVMEFYWNIISKIICLRK